MDLSPRQGSPGEGRGQSGERASVSTRGQAGVCLPHAPGDPNIGDRHHCHPRSLPHGSSCGSAGMKHPPQQHPKSRLRRISPQLRCTRNHPAVRSKRQKAEAIPLLGQTWEVEKSSRPVPREGRREVWWIPSSTRWQPSARLCTRAGQEEAAEGQIHPKVAAGCILPPNHPHRRLQGALGSHHWDRAGKEAVNEDQHG